MRDFSRFVDPKDLIVQRVPMKVLQQSYEWYYTAAKLQQPDKFLEFGVAGGHSSYAVLLGCGKKQPSLVTWIDFCEGKKEHDAKHMYALGLVRGAFDINLDDRFINSNEIIGFDHDYDLISIDGDHSTPGCYHDLQVSARHLTANGHILCHDANADSVRDAIDEFCIDQQGKFLQLRFTDVYQGCTIVHRNNQHIEHCCMEPMIEMFNK